MLQLRIGDRRKALKMRNHESSAGYLSKRIAHAGKDFAEVVARVDPRPRRAPSHPKELEVIPFDQLLNNPDNT